MNFTIGLAVGSALQVLIFAIFAWACPRFYRRNPPKLAFALAQLLAIVAFACMEVAG